MTRRAFQVASGVPLKKLQLDLSNPRIRAGSDQDDCIERLLRKPKQLLALAKDIAANGLSTAPILVEPLQGGNYVVWDGNRRITALKLMNEPAQCKNKALRSQFSGIASKASVPIPKSVDVLVSKDRDALFKEVLSRHATGQEGAGQLSWDALLRTMFLLGHKAPSDYRLSGLLLMWAEEHGIEVVDEFPITTIHRFVNKSNLARLGFKDGKDVVEPVIDDDDAVRVAERLVKDFGPNGRVGVNDVFSQEQQDLYINSLLKDLGLSNDEKSDTEQGRSSGGSDSGEDSSSGEDGQNAGRGRKRSAGKRARKKPDWDRKHVVRSTFKPDFPDQMWKADEVLRELRRTDTQGMPLSAAALFRMFFEMSTRCYMKRHKIAAKDTMNKNALAVAVDMRQHGRIDQGELEAANRRFKDKSQSEALLQYNTLNDYLHSLKAMPDRQSLHVLWTEIEAYLSACWDDARRPH